MPTRDLSCPTSSSSSSQYAQSHLQHATLQLLSSAGFARCSSHATSALAEVLQRYLALIASTAGQYASHSGRLAGNAFDVRTALHDLGTDVDEIYAWILDGDGRNVAGTSNGSIVPFTVASSSKASHHTIAAGGSLLSPPAVSVPDEGITEGPLILSANELGQRADHGKMRRGATERMQYKDIESDDFQSELLLQIQEAEDRGQKEDDKDDDNDGMELDEASDYSTKIEKLKREEEPWEKTNGSWQAEDDAGRDMDGEELVHRKEQPFPPHFLPNLQTAPSVDEAVISKGGRIVKTDGDYARARVERQKEVETRRREEALRAQEFAKQQQSSLVSSMPLQEQEPAQKVHKAVEMDALMGLHKPRKVLRDPWRSSIDFVDSTLASQQSIEDLPNMSSFVKDVEVSDRSHSLNDTMPKSSLRAFANDYRTLILEAGNNTGANLVTQPGLNFVRQFSKRRAIAATMADPSKFAPTDTLFASVPCRPCVVPFNPGPSLMITPPTATNPAPTFTPTHPHGRPAALVPSSGTLVPSLRYRHSDRTASAARLVGDGEVLKRVTRWTDPPPVLDEQHAERVFQGAPSTRDLLTERHSVLRAALDTLLVKQQMDRQRQAALKAAATAADAAAAAAAAEGGDEHAVKAAADAAAEVAALEAPFSSLHAAPDTTSDTLLMLSKSEKKGPKTATLVHTWDWLPRDPLDGVLPAKKFKGMPGIHLSVSNANGNTYFGAGQAHVAASASSAVGDETGAVVSHSNGNGGVERERGRSVSFSLQTSDLVT